MFEQAKATLDVNKKMVENLLGKVKETELVVKMLARERDDLYSDLLRRKRNDDEAREKDEAAEKNKKRKKADDDDDE